MLDFDPTDSADQFAIVYNDFANGSSDTNIEWFDTDEARAIRVEQQVKNGVIFLDEWEKRMQIIENGYGGNNNQAFNLNDDQKICMNADTLDDGSAVINFDVYDEQDQTIVAQNGFVLARQEIDHFMITVFDGDGDVLSETVVPFNFVEC